MTAVTGRNTRVIGWYHSHPHITVLPSHVDVRTQAMYQLLDSGFIGLIFSCFSEDAFKVGRIQVIAFQSLDGKQSHIARPVSISPVHKSVILDVESSSSNDASTRKEEKLEDTGDSKIAGSKSHGSQSQGKGRVGVNLHSDNVGGAFLDIDPMDVTEGVQEAMHQSHLDLSGAEYVRKEIPLQVVPASSLLKLASPLASFIDLQRVLYEEEKAAYNLAVSQSMRDGKVHPLTFIHHTSTYQASMCKLMEYCLTPAIEALEDRLRENEIRLATLTDEAKLLEAEASRGNEMISGSPHRGDGLRGSSAHGRGSVESMNARSPASPSTRSRKGS